jgi:site-specific DNA-methyltransferase (adenine-specific)
MIVTHTLRADATLFQGDMLHALDALPENCIDAVITDPPYHLTSIVERFGKAGSAPALSNGATGVYGRASTGFMGKEWDGGDIAFRSDTWRKVLRVLKPGGHVAAFGAPKNFGRMQVAILDAGFEERDTILRVIDPTDPVVQFIESLNAAQLGQFMRCLADSEMSGMLAWVFGSGFPKSQNVARFIDDHHFSEWLDASPERLSAYKSDMRIAGMVAHDETRRRAEFATLKRWRAVAGLHLEFGDPKSAAHAGWIKRGRMRGVENSQAGTDGWQRPAMGDAEAVANMARRYLPVSAEAREFDGWGTALKPAFEPIVLARKPLSEDTVAANMLRWRNGAMNVDACRVGSETLPAMRAGQAQLGTFERHDMVTPEREGRHPANLVHDGSVAVLERFPESKQGGSIRNRSSPKTKGIYGEYHGDGERWSGYVDSGSAARFFYNAKANKADRAGSKHPTIKPLSVMDYLCRLLCPPGGVVLDCFAGSGTTLAAAVLAGFKAVGVEREAEYVGDIKKRFETLTVNT